MDTNPTPTRTLSRPLDPNDYVDAALVGYLVAMWEDEESMVRIEHYLDVKDLNDERRIYDTDDPEAIARLFDERIEQLKAVFCV